MLTQALIASRRTCGSEMRIGILGIRAALL